MRRALLAVVLSLVTSLPARGQAGASRERCALQFQGDRLTTVELPSGQRNSFFGGGVVATCPQQRLTLRSDSLESYGDEARHFFIGHVDYHEPRLQLKADYLTYFQRDERILAFLNVDAQLPTGSSLKGSQLEFWRAIAGVRQQRGSSVSRPTITVIERDSLGRAQPPITVTGNTVWLEGDSIVASSGEVQVVRPELTATGDSLFLDGGSGLLRLMRRPRVVGTKGRPFTLIGETVDVLSRQRKLERVLSKTGAEATSEDLNLKSDTIDLRIGDDVLQRAISWGTSRARAISPGQTIIADSIDVLMPGQRVRELHAVRGAVAEGTPDTTRFRTTGKDRLTGDTIVAHFDTTTRRAATAQQDTAAKPRITRLSSTGHATSFQHLPARDTAVKIPAIVYVTGEDITVTFDSGTVRRVRVEDVEQAGGVYLEPAPAPDSAAAAAGTPPGAPPATGMPATPGSAAPTPAGPAPTMPAPTAPTPTTPAASPRRP